MKYRYLIIIILFVLVGTVILILLYHNNEVESESYGNMNIIENNIVIGEIAEMTCKSVYEGNKENEEIYNIINKEKIDKIKKLIENLELERQNDKIDEKDFIEIQIHDELEQIDLIIYKNNNIELEGKIYLANTNIYDDFINVLKPKYFLHDSNLELLSEDECKQMQNKALKGLTETEIDTIKEKLRDAHTTIEFLLIDGTRNLKQSNSIYWNLYNNAETIIEPTGVGLEFSTDNCFRAVANNINEVAHILQDKDTKEEFNNIYERLNKAMQYKDIAEMFEVHEKIHDFDYWIINYPAHYDVAPAPDWEGIETYFGTTIK